MAPRTNFLLERASVLVATAFLCAACGGSDDEPEKSKPDTKSFMTSYFEIFDKKNNDDILELYSPEVTAEISGLGKLDGRDAVRDTWLLPFTSAFPDYKHTVNSITAVDAQADADFVFEGTHQGPLLGSQPTGKKLVLPIKGTYVVEGEVVASFKLEYDVTVVFAAIQP